MSGLLMPSVILALKLDLFAGPKRAAKRLWTQLLGLMHTDAKSAACPAFMLILRQNQVLLQAHLVLEKSQV